MKPQVDKNLEQIYLNILIEKLQKLEEWEKDGSYDYYKSTCISGTKTYFKTAGKSGDDYNVNTVSIYGGKYDSTIHVLPINKWRVRRLIRKLHEYMKQQEEWKKYETLDKELRKGLPENIDRYLKLTKIRKKL